MSCLCNETLLPLRPAASSRGISAGFVSPKYDVGNLVAGCSKLLKERAKGVRSLSVGSPQIVKESIRARGAGVFQNSGWKV